MGRFMIVCLCSAGMAADPLVMAQLKRTGLGSLTPAQGLSALSGMMSGFNAHWQPQMAAVLVNWSIVLNKVLIPYCNRNIVSHN